MFAEILLKKPDFFVLESNAPESNSEQKGEGTRIRTTNPNVDTNFTNYREFRKTRRIRSNFQGGSPQSKVRRDSCRASTIDERLGGSLAPPS